MDFKRIRLIMNEVMESENLNQSEFSRSIGADQSYHGKFLRAESNTISLKYIASFCQVYNISMDWLVLELGQKYLKKDISTANEDIVEYKITEQEAKDKLIYMLEQENDRLLKENKILKKQKKSVEGPQTTL